MIDLGLPEEVHNLTQYKNLNALQTVGYKEMFDYWEGTTTYEEAVEAIKISTRRYAKRQMTWFKKDLNINWFTQGNHLFEDIISFLGIKIETV